MKYLRPSIILLVIAFLAFGLLIPHLGYYWDDLPIAWISYQLGPKALHEYFVVARPVWGILFQITNAVIPQNPVYWQVFGFAWRWICAVMVYVLVEKLWQGRERAALGVALLYLLYPGFNQHFAAYLYSHFYIVVFFLLFSWLNMLQADKSSNRYWVWTIFGMAFSALNLWMTEYFYTLELVRVGIILVYVRNEKLSISSRVLRTSKMWMPYLALFVFAALSRLFIFNNPDYGMGLTSQLQSAPLEALIALARSVRFTMQLVLRDAWMTMFELGDIANPETVLTSYYFVVAAVILVGMAGFLLLARWHPKPETANTKSGDILFQIKDGIWMIGLGGLAVSLAGWPFWLINFEPSLNWPASRFTLPFILGIALVFTGAISLIPWKKLQIVLLVFLVSMAAGKQYLISQDYSQDWEVQKNLFWQMNWRAPGMEPDTLMIMNEGALDYYADNSLSAALNWIYAPDNHSDHIEFVLFYPKTRFRGALPEFEPGLPVYFDYISGEFKGNTSQTLAFYFDPPGCLRLLDPDVERVNRLIPENSLMRYAARISDPRLIIEEPRARMPEFYDPEPEHDFCYYYQKADLARQLGEWDMVVEFADIALAFEVHPYEPAEHLVFIEGYAHAGQWERAIDLSKRGYDYSNEFMGRVLCQLWERIEAETAGSPESDALSGETESNRIEALAQVQSMFACNP